MTRPSSFRLRMLAKVVLGLFAAQAAPWAMAYNLGSVSAEGSGAPLPTQGPATQESPTQASLTATEPQTIISQQYISNNLSPAADYNDIAAIAPSVWNVSPNGPGAGDAPAVTMRSFQDGQYNVTFDGIPFYDGADFTHHVTAYFMAFDTKDMVIDRGPGGAAMLGQATYGGTMMMHSKDPEGTHGVTAYAGYGSFATKQVGVRYDTGMLQNYGDMSAFVSYKHMDSKGFLTNNPSSRDNVFMKMVKPLSGDSALIFVAMLNRARQHVSIGSLLSPNVPGGPAPNSVAQDGYNYGYSNNPLSQSYWGYNGDQFKSDFEYLGYQSRSGNWQVDNKAYTYSYRHDAILGNDANGAQAISSNTFSPTGVTTAIPGQYQLSHYRSVGDVIRFTRSYGLNDLKFGLWLDHQIHNSTGQNVNFLSYSLTGPGSAFNQAENSSTTTIQPYVEYVWHPSDKWAVTPGVKYNEFTRKYNDGVNNFMVDKSWGAALPSIDVHYYLNDQTAIYAQAAEGLLAPAWSVFTHNSTGQTAQQAANSISAQRTKNYQIGTTWKTPDITLAGDVYYITNSNFYNKFSPAPGFTEFQDLGAATFKGIEGEASYYIGHGFDVFANASVNDSAAPGGPVQNAPQNTAAAGVTYQMGPYYASLTTKKIGGRYSGYDINNNPIHFGSYSVTDLALAYNINQGTKVNVQLGNLFNRQEYIMSPGNTANNGNPLYYMIVGRNVNVMLTTSFW